MLDAAKGTSAAGQEMTLEEALPHPLLRRLVEELGYPLLADMAAFDAFVQAPGWHVAFVPGDPARNLETADVAVVLPELVAAFNHAFDAAVVAVPFQRQVQERLDAFQTPNLTFWHEGHFIGDIPKMRDWDNYMERIPKLMMRSPLVS